MKIYLAGIGGIRPWPWDFFHYYDFYRLESYWEVRKYSDYNPHLFKDYILDSGVFTMLNGKIDVSKVDWEEYAAGYADFVKAHRMKNYVELDLDRIIGLDNVEKVRKVLEARVGWPCMPVWHLNRGWDKWLEICRDYAYVCFGAFLTDGMPKKQFKYIPRFIREADKRGCKVHGLGFTCMDYLKDLHFYSVDSSSWTVNFRYCGGIFKFTGDAIKPVKKPEGTKAKSLLEIARHDFKEWVAFSKYADRNL